MKAIELIVFDAYNNKNLIYVNPIHIEFIEVNPQSKTSIHLYSGRQLEVIHTIDEVKLKLGIED